MNWQFLSWRQVSRLIPGAVAALVVLSLLQLNILNPLERLAYIALFKLRSEIPWNQQVVVIGIDDASVTKLGRFPWTRKHYATLLKNLSVAKPNMVVFDVIFSETTPEDTQLAQAMSRHGLVVLAQAWDAKRKPLVSTPTLQAAAIASGHIAKYQDPDGITRYIAPSLQGIPALGIAAGDVYATTWDHVHTPDFGAPLWINYPGAARGAPLYSFVDILEGKIPAQTFKNKIILIGATAIGLDSINSTPFDRNSHFSGVYLHAVVLNNLLDQSFLRRLSPELLFTIVAVISIFWSLIITRWSLRWQLVAWLVGCLVWAIISLAALKLGYWLLPVASPMMALSLSTAFLVVSQRFKQDVAIQDLQRQINIDALTQIANRRCFNEYLDQEWRRGARAATPLSLILCDVDFFKKYNDTYGHQAGDSCLQRVAQAMQQSVKRPADLVARYGGEEFAVILPNTDAAGAMHIAEIIRARIKALAIPHAASQASEYVTLSLGVYTKIPDAQDAQKLLIAKADQALYAAKEQGRDRSVFLE
ncbi:diguanylate cyclase domain-containing protein [Fortiea contorta]|uniref:diguanylate cyclase domain-containing protein n=1 Tax=Fortiea contorta TaxID=1892405 RepID=UPI000345A6D2|nr:diguanylate cyclase [Fortiea contorta]